jgi:hypothetical protein
MVHAKFSLGFVLGCAAMFLWAGDANAQTLRILTPEQWRPGHVSVWESDFTSRERFEAFDASHKFGGNLASYDLDGDGSAELIIGAGEGSKPRVKIFSQDGKLIASFLAYPETFLGGVRVAAGDLNRDGKAEIVTSPGPGMEPLVRIFDKDGKYSVPNGFHAYAPGFGGGVHVAVGDVNGDGKDEIVTTPGPGGGPHVRVFNEAMTPIADAFAFHGDMKDGITPAIIRTPTGSEIVIGVESWSEPIVKRMVVRDGVLHAVHEFLAFDREWKHGVTVKAVDVNGDGYDEIAAHGNGGGVPELRILSKEGTILGKYMIHDPSYRGGLSVTQIPGQKKIASISRTPLVVGSLDEEKEIHVNITQQRLYAFERGRLANTFLVSTGVYKYPTPTLDTKVLQKVPVKTYRWSYGPGHPDNYNLPNVKWNLRIYGPYYIHGAYWHNNFGNRMSHGCINVHNTNAEWIYDWADIGTPVKTHD